MISGVGRTWIPYCGSAPGPSEWLGRWNLDPPLLIVLAAAAGAWYLTVGREDPQRRLPFAAALALLLLLFVTPFCALTSALFAARVTHHVVLTAVAAPLLVLSMPRRWTNLPGPLAFWTAAQALIFWAWHSPGLYAAALSSDAVYWLMQLSMLGAAAGFWATLRRVSPLPAVAALLATMVQMGLLGALITFSASPLYAPHFASTLPWGLSPLEDQQFAGLIMWAPSAGLYLAAALVIAARWFGRETEAAEQ